ncbi:putative ester cyclase [Flavobacterium sp. 270]|uniref:ester cyclase n=1 Tax=Flavobacterium sp. 270 TaxID=2512114 RepID=UPI001066D014|nr:ester cyclase [Flavobacterium sp. 270]TDW48825.1 putative ester cyclase [Flavobacterium sp. 270]
MKTEENKALLVKYNKEVIENGDMNFFREIATSDFLNHSAPEGMPSSIDGVIYFFTNILHAAFSEIKVEVLDMIAEGDKVVTRKLISGTHTGDLFGIAPTGKNVEIKVIDIFTVYDGKLKEHWGENNFGEVIQSLKG